MSICGKRCHAVLDVLCVLVWYFGELDGQDVCCVLRVLLGDVLDVYRCVPVDVRCAYLFTNGQDVCVGVVVCGRVDVTSYTGSCCCDTGV